MKIKIYSQDGTLKLTASPGSGGQCVKQLQGDSELTLSFDYFEYVALDVNDYMDFCGDRYWLLEQYRPKEVSTVQWKFDVHLYGIESLIKRYLVIEHTDGDANPVFTLTAPASQHMRMIVECLNNATGTTDWHVGTVETTGNITIDYTGKYCDEGLRELAEAANTEYWFDGRTVNLCKCERGTALQLGYDDGLISLERDVADNAKFYTRLYPVGSSRNINPETYGHTRLQLPDGQKYVDLDVAKYGVIDHYEQEAFSGIYPRYTGTVSGVRVEDRTDEDGTEFKVFFFSDASLPFDPNSYLLPNEKMRVSFQTGDLQGLGDTDDHYFEADYNSTTGEFEIINIWTEGEQLPRPGLSPAVGDQYIPWNISMPASYISLAEQEFAAAVNTYNQEHFKDISVYRGTTDHVWIEADPAQDKPEVDVFIGRRVRLVSSQYFPGTGYRDSRIVKITRRLDLPSQMELEISDAVSTGTLTKISDDIRGVWEFAKGLEVDGDDRWLSKRRNDTAQGFIRFIRGLQVGERFVTGLLGEGGVFRKEADGTTYLETDKLYIRMKAYFDTVEIRKYLHSGGNRIASVAGVKCVRVEWLDSTGDVLEQTDGNLSSVAKFRCYFRGSDGESLVTNDFLEGDLAYCHITNAESSSSLYQHHFWRLVVGKSTETNDDGEHYIDLSNANNGGRPVMVSFSYEGQGGTTRTMSALSFQAGSDIPVPQDDIIQLGSVNFQDRRGAIIEFVSGADAPSYQIFQDLGSDATNPYSLTGKNYVRFGYDSASGGAQVYIGNPDESTYLWYHNVNNTPQLDIKANVTFTSPTTHQDITLEDFANAIISDIGDLQDQIDGNIESWFYDYMPVAENEGAPVNNTPLVTRTVSGQTMPVYPYYDWFRADGGDPETTPVTQPTSTTERLKHLGDTFYDNTSGYAFRFSNTGTAQSPTFAWVVITDSAVVKALQDAAKAKDTADHKRRVFILPATIEGETYDYPYPPYDIGDLWVNAVYPATGTKTYDNDILRCRTAKAEGESFSILDWTLASRYTDDTLLHNYVTAILGNQSYTSGDEALAAAAENNILDALDGATVVDGGLLLTSLIAMRKYKGTGSKEDVANYNTWGGISGLYKDSETGTGWKGHGIAAWYGGAMVDKECISPTPSESSWNTYKWARSLFRFDGSGYVANGNISWNDSGDVNIQGVTINAATLQKGGSDVATESMLAQYLPLSAGSDKPLTDTLYSQTIVPNSTTNQYDLGSQARFFNNLFIRRIYLYKPNANDTNAVYLEYNSTSGSQGVHLVGAGFYSDSFVSAFGIGTSGGGTVSLCAPLNNINNNIDQNPAVNGATFVWNNTTSKFVYSNVDGQKLYVGRGGLEIGNSGNLTVSGSATVTGNVTVIGGGFVKSGSSNDYVLLAGGGTALLSDIGGGSYLPRSGGELTGTLTIGTSSLATQLTILRKHASNGAFIEYSNNSGRLGLLGFSSNGLFARLGTDTTNLTVWHSGNLTPSDYALASSVYSKTEADDKFLYSSKRNSFTPNGTGWYRIGYVGRTAMFDFNIWLTNSYGQGHYKYAGSSYASSSWRIVELYGQYSSSYIPKIRLVYNSSDTRVYIEVYYGYSSANREVHFNFFYGSPSETVTKTADTPADTNESVIKEFTGSSTSDGRVVTDTDLDNYVTTSALNGFTW